jgi:hypothetical protein
MTSTMRIAGVCLVLCLACAFSTPACAWALFGNKPTSSDAPDECEAGTDCWESAKVASLDDDNFDDVVSQHQHALVRPDQAQRTGAQAL